MGNKKFIRFSLKFKFSGLVSILITIVVLGIGYLLIDYQKNKLTEELLKRGGILAKNLSYITLESYTTSDIVPIVMYCRNLLKEDGVVEAFFLTKKGYVVAHSDTGKITPEPPKEIDDVEILQQFKPSKLYNNDFFQKGENLLPGKFNFQLYKNDLFYDIYTSVQLKKRYFGTCHIIFSRDIIFKAIQESRVRIQYIALLTLSLGLIGALLLSSSIVKPIKKLAKGAEIIGTGNLDHSIEVRSRDEVGFLANRFNNMTVELKKAQKVLLEKQKIEDEIKIASEIQQTLLPERFPEFPSLEFGAYYLAAREVGGDYYDFIKISEDKVGIIIADVSGKGVPASLVMSMFRSTLRSVISPEVSAYDTLCKVNETLIPDIVPGMFVTVFYGILNVKTNMMNFANAGHDPLLVYNISEKKLRLAHSDGFPVGIIDKEKFNMNLKNRNVRVQKNDFIVLNTDGVNEAMNNGREMYGDQRFYNAIKKYCAKHSKDFVKSIKEELSVFVGEAPQSDDITLIAIKVK